MALAGNHPALPSERRISFQAFIESFIGAGDDIPSLFIYAIIVTVIAVIVTVLIARVAGKMGVETE